MQSKKKCPCWFPENTTECMHRAQTNHWHFVAKKMSKKSHMWNGRGNFFCSRFTCGSVGPLVCVNAAKCVICGNTNPFGCAKTQVCASMFQPVHSTVSVASTFITMMEKKMVLAAAGFNRAYFDRDANWSVSLYKRAWYQRVHLSTIWYRSQAPPNNSDIHTQITG